ncbi:hypothetical protein WICPIJ_007050 [Wickerhamomyces pijperi]|uniref:Uncharacterized protein n=1 Tax=Wickerhamomyces pijperi TaxID=599730 RepID=A0A9P8TKC8_WICPI|nr:hypothetical protein WICPIJ_007050 [Wickerhamomyces pijperi]
MKRLTNKSGDLVQRIDNSSMINSLAACDFMTLLSTGVDLPDLLLLLSLDGSGRMLSKMVINVSSTCGCSLEPTVKDKEVNNCMAA